MIDNFGDMGVCWRLARQLTQEYGFTVTLWIDDLHAFSRFLGKEWVAAEVQREFGVCVRHWRLPWKESAFVDATIAESSVVIEAFACELPASVITAMARQARPPLWINLEYLSAESWVAGCHQLQSLVSVQVDRPEGDDAPALVTLSKTFFFPGFTTGTGGLLREQELLSNHAAWQRDEQASRRQLLAQLGLPDSCADIGLWISVFTYESAAFASWLRALSEAAQPTFCLVPEGRALTSITAFLGRSEAPAVGDLVCLGALTLLVIPFLSQDNYDLLLSVCDLNLVRGEDSFVRAQWAGKPLIWHIYPQQNDVHMEKLDAFLALYEDAVEAGKPAEVDTLRQFCRVWNLGEDCRELWHHLRPQLPGLREQAGKWRHHLVQLPDLAENLVQFYRAGFGSSGDRSATSPDIAATDPNFNVGPGPSNFE